MRHATGTPRDKRRRHPSRIVIEIWAEPTLHLLHRHAFAQMVIKHLIPVDFPQTKVTRLWMREVETADAAAWPHRKRLGQFNAGILFDTEQFPKNSLFGMIWTSWISGGRTNTAVFLGNLFVSGEVFQFAEAPLIAHPLVQILRECFGKAVGESFSHNRVVIVVIRFECFNYFPQAVTTRHRECADVIWNRW